MLVRVRATWRTQARALFTRHNAATSAFSTSCVTSGGNQRCGNGQPEKTIVLASPLLSSLCILVCFINSPSRSPRIAHCTRASLVVARRTAAHRSHAALAASRTLYAVSLALSLPLPLSLVFLSFASNKCSTWARHLCESTHAHLT